MTWGKPRKLGKCNLLLPLLALCWAASAQAASFDCAKAGTAVEKMICTDAGISKLDDEMAVVYEKALQQNEQQAAAIRQEQKQWLKYTRNACNDVDCMREAYLTRQVSLLAMWGGIVPYHQGANEEEPACQTRLDDGGIVKPKNALPAQGNKWVCDQSEHDAKEPLCHVCNDLVRWLNRYKWKASQVKECSWGVLASYPEFSAPPWEDLDSKKYKDLIAKLECPKTPLNSECQDLTERFIKHGGRLQVWRTNIPAELPMPARVWSSEILPSKERTLIRMSGAFPMRVTSGFLLQTQSEIDAKASKTCKGLPKVSMWGDGGTIFYVTSDLNGPDPDVFPGPFSDLKIYRGIPVFAYYGGISFYSPSRKIYCCSLSFTQGGK